MNRMSDLISRQAAIDAVKHAWAKGLEPTQYLEELPSAEPTLYGYNLDYLIAFALACERAEVSNEDLKEFANNYEFAFDTVQKEFEKSVLAEMARRCEREGE